MQALSSYNPEWHSTIECAVQDFQCEHAANGLSAKCYFTARGLFTKFVWPDWPETLARELAGNIEVFRRRLPELLTIQEGTPEWNCIFHGWRADPVSACIVAEVFSRHFDSPARKRVLWVESVIDVRGKVAATCAIARLGASQRTEPLAPAFQVAGRVWNDVQPGEVMLHLFWKDCTAIPRGLFKADQRALQQAIQEVFGWAEHRIQAILDALRHKLKKLYGEQFRGLYVFGSYARPDAGIELPVDSDLDVAVLLSDIEDRYREIEAMSEMAYDLSLEHGLSVSLTPIREAEFREGSTSFAKGISAYAKPA